MENPQLLLSLMLIKFSSFLLLYSNPVVGVLPDGQELGYINVRENVRLFWWLDKTPANFRTEPWPIVLWLEGGPGRPSSGVGNYEKIGSQKVNLEGTKIIYTRRESSWVKKADLLFVDSPVGTGFSYVVDKTINSLVTSDKEAVKDLLEFLKAYFAGELQKRPLHIFGEGYGGKTAVLLGLAILEGGEQIKVELKGIGLGNSWISPADSVFVWGSLLKDMSRLDDNGFQNVHNLAQAIISKTSNEENKEATAAWIELKSLISLHSHHVDLYDFSEDAENDRAKYTSDEFHNFMNGEIRNMLGDIPPFVRWKSSNDDVLREMSDDFMKPVIGDVSTLLAKGVLVVIYNGQLDIACSTKGAEAWVEKIEWTSKDLFLNMDRTTLYHYGTTKVAGYLRAFKNLKFYWILDAGHSVPIYQPWISYGILAGATTTTTVTTTIN